MNETIINAFNFRYATKVFDPSKKVAQGDIDTIIEAGRLSPTAYGLQPFKIIKVEDMSVREELKIVSYGQAQVTDSSVLFVIAARTDIDEAYITDYIQRIADTRGMKALDLDGFKQTMIGDICNRSEEAKLAWAGRQSYIALGSMLETAALLGADACPMEGFNNSEVDRVLGLSDHNLTSLAYLTIGYRGEDAMADMKKVRFSREGFVVVK